MEAKIRMARLLEKDVRSDLRTIKQKEHDMKDQLLMHYFFLEQLSSLKRFALKREFLQLHRLIATCGS